ncbi:MAG: hypothetical protein EBR82_74060 [Caulobacteraceae bacterium]|nr:hypothetical protein [Caulobacteraceae bacterium]
MNLDSMGALEVLKEIKALMDERLGSKMASPTEDLKEDMQEAMGKDAKGVEVSKVKVLGKKPGEEEGLTPEEDMVEDAKEVSDVDPELLKKIRESLA